MYILIFMLLTLQPDGNIQIAASRLGTFDNFVSCFEARDSFTEAMFGMPKGFYPPNTQAVCIPVIPDETNNS